MSKLSVERVDQIKGLVAMGLSPRDATVVSGVSQATFYNWWRQGEGDATSGDPVRMGSVYAGFYRDVWGAKVGLDVKILDVFVRSHLLGPKTEWQAFRWWLSKRLPDDFGDKVGQRPDLTSVADQVELIAGMREMAGLSSAVDRTDRAPDIVAGDERAGVDSDFVGVAEVTGGSA